MRNNWRQALVGTSQHPPGVEFDTLRQLLPALRSVNMHIDFKGSMNTAGMLRKIWEVVVSTWLST